MFYIVQQGSVICRDLGGDRTRQPDVRLGVGDYFGERALLTNEACAATVVGQYGSSAAINAPRWDGRGFPPR